MANLGFVIVALSMLCCQSSAQDLTAVECEARLPFKMEYVSSLYDGDDTVYLIGGIGDDEISNQTLKYSISQDIIEPAGEFPQPTYAGRMVTDKNNNIYHLGGGPGIATIYQYFLESKTFQNISSLPRRNYEFALIKPDLNTAFIFGGREDLFTVLNLDLNNFQSAKIADLPKAKSFNFSLGVLWVEEKNAAYIFDGELGYENVTKYHRATNTFETLPNYFPDMWGSSQVVYDGRFGYIIGGFGSTETSVPYNAIMQFDPETEDIKFIRVLSYPGWNLSGFSATSAVYIEKLDRIYLFGGYTRHEAFQFRDEIWYIDLEPLRRPQPTTSTTTPYPITTLDPEIFDCYGLGDSVHPYEGTECKRFIICRYDNTHAFDCPVPLLFHATNLKCMWPDLVDCQK